MPTNQSDPVAREYAKALFMLGQEKGNIGVVYQELSALDEAYRTDRTFRTFFTSPEVPAEMKQKIVLAALGGQASETIKGLVTLLIRKGRESLVDNIMDAFAKHRDEAENRVHVFIESAAPLGEAERSQLQNSIAQASGKSVVLHESQHDNLIGGVRIRIGDALFDNTVATRLSALANMLAGRDNAQLGAGAEDPLVLFENARRKVAAGAKAHA